MDFGISRRRPRASRTRLGAAFAVPALLALLSAAASPALAANRDSYVVVTQAENGKAIDLPNDGALAVVLQVNGGTGYEWRTTEVPSSDVIGAPVHGIGPYFVASSSLPGAPVSVVFYFAALAPGATTFAAALYPPASDTPAETFSVAIRVRDESGATASLTYGECGDIVGIDSDGTVGMTLDSNATTGYSWSVISPPDATLAPANDNGTYLPPPADAPIGAGGSQHFGWLATGAGSAAVELAYTQVGSQTAGRTCSFEVVAGTPVPPPDAAPTDSTGTTATPPPTSTADTGDTLPSPAPGLLLVLAVMATGSASVPVLLTVQRRRDR
jgi:predicted secreted protein